MKERSIILDKFEVGGVLSGARTQLRRVIGVDSLRKSDTPDYDWTFRGRAPIRSIIQQRRHPSGCWQDLTHAQLMALCPYGGVGDRLWVQETWCLSNPEFDAVGTGDGRPRGPRNEVCYYAASDDGVEGDNGKSPWRPSIFMPRWASRLTLQITEVRIQRLQEITPEDACDEGSTAVLESGHPLRAECYAKHGTWAADDQDNLDGPFTGAVEAFATTWDASNAKHAAWASNPWIWALTFLKAP